MIHEEGKTAGSELEIAPEILLPVQVAAGFRSDALIDAEKALMLAVLEDGIRCFQAYLQDSRANPRKLSADAEAWVRAVDYDWPFSFENVCDTLGISADRLRGELLAWKAKRQALVESAKQAAVSPPPVGEHKGQSRIYRLHLRTKSKR